MTIRICPITVVALAALGAGAALPAQAQITPVDIPASFGIGDQGTTIQGWIANNQQSQIRGHGWMVWAGLNAPSGQSHNGAVLPVWETWLGTDEVFAVPTKSLLTADKKAVTAPARHFVKPHQFGHLAQLAGKAAASKGDALQVVSFNKFSPSAASFIAAPQTIAGLSGSYAINTKASLATLNSAWAASVPTTNRAINDFPVDALELKPVFGVVAQKGYTPLPLWQGPSQATNATNPTPNTWKTCVAVDPAGTGGTIPISQSKLSKADVAALNAAAKSAGLACTVGYYAPVGALYNFTLSADEAAAMKSAQGVTASAGDYAVLFAMHVNSKEVPFWTWQTYYWQPGPDTPNKFPGSKADAPASLPAPFNNYAMCTSYSQTIPVNSTKMAVCFNPYLETDPGIPAGITSNCVSCHGLAGVGTGPNYPANYSKPINFFGDAKYFTKNSTRTDFSWAVASPPN